VTRTYSLTLAPGRDGWLAGTGRSARRSLEKVLRRFAARREKAEGEGGAIVAAGVSLSGPHDRKMDFFLPRVRD